MPDLAYLPPETFQPHARTVFTLPGRLGDNLARLPIAYRYAWVRGVPVDVCVNEGTAKALVPLLSQLSWVARVYAATGIQHDGCGGQPWDFGKPEFFAERYHEVYHLGYRSFPQGNLTRESVPPDWPDDVASAGLLLERPLGLTWKPPPWNRKAPRRLSIAAYSSRPHADWATRITIDHAWQDHGLDDRFDAIAPDTQHLPLMETASIFAKSVVVTTYSAMCQLAAIIGAPCVVLIPKEGYGLGHYDSRIRWYPGWEIADEGDPKGLVEAVDRAVGAALAAAARDPGREEVAA